MNLTIKNDALMICTGEKKEISEKKIEISRKTESSSTRQIQVVQTQETGEQQMPTTARDVTTITADVSSRRHDYEPAVMANIRDTNRGEPVFTRPLQSMRVKPASHACFECRLLGNTSRVLWYRNGEELTPSPHLEYQTNMVSNGGGEHLLIVKDVYADDVGSYMARATNSCGSATSVAKLTVQG